MYQVLPKRSKFRQLNKLATIAKKLKWKSFPIHSIMPKTALIVNYGDNK